MRALDRAVAGISVMRPAAASLLSRGHLTRSIGVIALGHAAAYGVMLATTPILSRLYSPAQFGVMASFSALVSLAGTSISLRYESAIPLPRSRAGGRRLAQLSVVVALVASTAWGLALAAAARRWADWPRLAELAPFAAALAAALFAYGCFQTLTFWATRTRQFSRLAQQRVVLVAATVIVQIAAACWRPSAGGLNLGQMAGDVAAVAITGWRLGESWAARRARRRAR
jgi:O-antigen/teichoic acid export membrane protein